MVKFDSFVLMVVVDRLPVIQKLFELGFDSLSLLQQLDILRLAPLHCSYV